MNSEPDKNTSTVRYYTFAEIKKENCKANKSLIVILNSVYDVHAFLRDHPGGVDVITEHESKDATGAFFAVGHSSEAKKMLSQYEVGQLVHSERFMP